MEARRRPRGPLPGLLALLLLLRPCGSQTVSSVVCVGDSITYGRTKVAEDGSDGYPHKLEARLGWSHWSVTNLGESGSTAQDVKGDGYVRYSGFYDEALALAADFYVVMLGTNDAKLEHWNATAYEAAIVGLCEAFVAVGGRIVLGVPPPLVKDGHRHWGAAADNAINTELPSMLARIAGERGYRLADTWAAFGGYPVSDEDAEALYVDDVHPSAAGYDLIAKTVWAALDVNRTWT